VPFGALIYLLANVDINGISILRHLTLFLDPFGKIIGLDGVILIAFLLGFPANEIVIPIMIMAYMSNGYMVEYESLETLKTLLIDNGWTYITAVSMIILTLLHFPCATTLLTIKKETGSIKWTAISAILPTLMGITLCFITSNILRLIEIII